MSKTKYKLPIPTESEEQIALFEWAEWEKNKYPDLKWMFHIANGGKRNIVTAKRLKSEGLKPGVPDICLPVPKGEYHGLYVEMKRKGNTTSKYQDEWLQALSDYGYCTAVCYSCESAKDVIMGYLKLQGELSAENRD